MPLSRKPTTVSPRRVVAVVTVAILALVGLIRYQHFRQLEAQAEVLTLQHLRSAATVAAARLDAEAVARLHAAYPGRDDIADTYQDEDYARLHRALRRTHVEFELSTPIYLTLPTDSDSVMQLTVTSAEAPYWRHEAAAVATMRGHRYGEAGQLGVYLDEAGGWLSAFAPVYGPDGAVVAMVQADECFDVFRANAIATMVGSIWWNLALVLVAVGALAYYLAGVMRRERRRQRELEAAVAQQRALTEALTAKQDQLAAQSQALERSNRDLTDFANIASHDLKSPLRGISNFAQLLARRNRATLDPSSNEYLDFIISSARRATDLVDGLLKYATSGEASAKTQDVRLDAVAAQAVQALQAVIDDRGARVTVAPLPEASCDAVLVSQLFQNLIGNGLKYNRSAAPEVHVDSVRGADGHAVFRVRDNGIGIAAADQPRVFEMFRRLHGEGEFEGSGIGLAFCVRLVGRYGGRVWLESEEGVGSTFFFTLPEAVGQAAGVEASGASLVKEVV